MMIIVYVTCSFSGELAKYVGDTLVFNYPGLEDVLYCDNDTGSVSTQDEESGLLFTTLSNSGHKHCSLSKLGKQISDTVL